MIVREVEGDVFTYARTMDRPFVAHGVNTQGVMGAGIATQVRRFWPELFDQYAHVCHVGLLRPGGYLAYDTGRGWVMNLATQDAPGAHARLEWIAQSMAAAARFAEQHHAPMIAMPRIGAGIGGLRWDQVRQVLEAVDSPVTAQVLVLPQRKAQP